MTPDRQDKPPLSAADIIMAAQREEVRKRVLKEEGERSTEKRLALMVDELRKLVDEQYSELEDIDRRFGLTSSLKDVDKGPLLNQGKILKEKRKPSFEPKVTYDEEGVLWKGEVKVEEPYPPLGPARLPTFIDLPVIDVDLPSEKKEEVKKLAMTHISLNWGEDDNGGNAIHLSFGKEGININGGKCPSTEGSIKLDFSDPEFHDKFQNALANAYFRSKFQIQIFCHQENLH